MSLLTGQLSPREEECLDLCAHGLSDHEMAGRLGVTCHAIRFHLANLKIKLGATNRAHAVFIACTSGLLPIDDRNSLPSRPTEEIARPRVLSDKPTFCT